MADAFKVLDQRQLAAAAATIYTVPALTQAIVKKARLVNTSGATVSGIKLFVGGTAAANQVTPSLTLLAGEGIDYDLDATLAAAATMAGVAGTATAVTCTLFGMEVS